MIDLLARVWDQLRPRGIDAAIIGATALAAYGVSRSTHDIDLLVMDRAVLTGSFWDGLTGVTVDVRPADADDPLAGVVRCSQAGFRPIDIVVGRHRWMHHALMRVRATGTEGPPVIERADWVCLKLFAGGIQDLSDVAQLRAISAGLDRDVTARLTGLPVELATRWARVTEWGDA